MAISQTSLRTSIGAGSAGAIADTNTEHQAVNDLTTAFNGWTVGTLGFNVKSYGAAGDGSANDTTAVQAAITAAAAAGGGVVYFPAGSYRVTTGLTVTASKVFLRGANRKTTRIIQDGTPSILLSFAGSLPVKASPTATLTADAGWSNDSTSAGATATLSTVAGISVDDVFLIGDDAIIPWTSGQWNTRYAGEMQRVKSINAGTKVVTFSGRLRGTYTTARNAAAYKVTCLRNVGVENIAFENVNPLTSTTTMVRFFACRDVSVSDVSIDYADNPGVELDYVFGADIDHLLISDSADDTGAGRYGYGANIGPSEMVSISNSRFLRCRHGVTTNGYDGHLGFAHGAIVSQCAAIETTAAAFDTHPGSDVTFVGCKASQTADTAFSLRSQARLANCEAAYANIGVYVQGAAASDVEIIDQTIHHTVGAAITFWGDGTAGYPDNTSIVSPNIRDIRADAIVVAGAVARLSIVRPRIVRCGNGTSIQPAGINIGAGLTSATITGAEVEESNSGVLIAASAGLVRVTGTRTRALNGSSTAAVKGAGITDSTVILENNLDLDLNGLTDPFMPQLPANTYIYTNSPGANSNTTTLGVGQLRVAPWAVRRKCVLSSLGADINTAGEAGAKVRVVVYRDNGVGYPGVLVADSGQLVADAVAVVFGTVSVTLPAGLYWTGVVVQNVVTTQPSVRIASNWTPPIDISAGTSAPSAAGVLYGWQISSVTGSPPNPFTAGGGPSSTVARAIARLA